VIQVTSLVLVKVPEKIEVLQIEVFFVNLTGAPLENYSQLPPWGHLAITDNLLLRTAAKSPAKVTDV